jgi:DNA-binding NarL/FixJ family response regulator
MAGEQKDAMVKISPREAEVLRFLAQGLTNKEVAKKMEISDQTVKNHLMSISKKTGINNRTLLALFALRNGYVTQESIDQTISEYKRSTT